MLKYIISAQYPHIEALTSKVVKFLRKATEEDGVPENAVSFKMSAKMFPQIWKSTAGGMDDGEMTAEQKETKEYTTIFTVLFFVEEDKNSPVRPSYQLMYVVCFGDRIGYTVVGDNHMFFVDLNDSNVACVGKARERYGSSSVKLFSE